METNFNFNSQICTTREQSERLLALGLKRETADMAYLCYGRAEDDSPMLMDKPSLVYQGIMTKNDIPAWSLHRLVEMMSEEIDRYFCTSFLTLSKHNVYYNESVDGAPDMEFEKNNLYESILNCIEWLIKEGYFPKEYLV